MKAPGLNCLHMSKWKPLVKSAQLSKNRLRFSKLVDKPCSPDIQNISLGIETT